MNVNTNPVQYELSGSRGKKRHRTDDNENGKLTNPTIIRNPSETADAFETANSLRNGNVPHEVIIKLLETDKFPQNEVHDLLKILAENLRSEMQEKIKDVWIGFRNGFSNVPIVAIISFNNGVKLSKEDIPESYRSFECIFRHEYEVSEEAREIIDNKEIRRIVARRRQMKGLQETLANNINQLLSCHSNIEMVGISSIRSVKYGHINARLIPETCIVIYVHVKGIIPYDEKMFPRSMGNYLIDVPEGKFISYSDVPGPRDYHQHLSMGCQIVRKGGLMGTIGGFLDMPNGNVGILTCAHVVMTNKEREEYINSTPDEQLQKQKTFPWCTHRICQPDEYREFGTVLKFVLTSGSPSEVGVDAAIVTVTEQSRLPISGRFPKNDNITAGYESDSQMEFSSGQCIQISEYREGCEVVKFGATTGITRGLLAHSSLHAKRSNMPGLAFKNFMYNQMEIEPLKHANGFALPGDSGALVFMAKRGNRKKLVAVGMVVGGTTSNTTVVTPILNILNALKQNVCFKKFEPCIRPRQITSITSLEELKKGQEKQTKQIKEQDKRIRLQNQKIDKLEREMKKGTAKTHKMIDKILKKTC
ncbi:hypothetical protein CHS0354_023625 [Potamilus streckersoni]|uniref:Uncharacterized protein n=1 Tax=Potamilus streckersoni TaxID=2493646 RepID=A0AAE0SYH4_9BIVA|nr:hypothetical protein CHS0354_023625 [Potamilus streckersoni]